MSTALTLSIFTAPAQPINVPLDIPAPDGGWTWPSTSVTLIAGETDAILVDTVPTLEESAKLADWITASGKNLTTIYITHGHFDHFLGATYLLERFPNARMVAAAETQRLVQEEADTGKELATYSQFFVAELGSVVTVPEVAEGRLELEGHEVLAVPAGPSDVEHSSYVHIPELGAVITGDIAYSDVHPTLVESTLEGRKAWIETLTEIKKLDPRIVIAAHRGANSPTDGNVLDRTIGYLEEVNRFLATEPTAPAFIAHMAEVEPDRINPTTIVFGTATLGLPQA